MSENVYRIRKLTPRECWRLMGFSTRDENGTWNDECFEKAEAVSSNTRLYKAAGNSIVVDCLYHILKNLPLEKEPEIHECVYCCTRVPKGWSKCPICGNGVIKLRGLDG